MHDSHHARSDRSLKRSLESFRVSNETGKNIGSQNAKRDAAENWDKKANNERWNDALISRYVCDFDVLWVDSFYPESRISRNYLTKGWKSICFLNNIHNFPISNNKIVRDAFDLTISKSTNLKIHPIQKCQRHIFGDGVIPTKNYKKESKYRLCLLLSSKIQTSLYRHTWEAICEWPRQIPLSGGK